MFATALIVFRESLEAALFVGILAAATRGLVNAARIRLMRPGSALLNFARAEIVVEHAVAAMARLTGGPRLAVRRTGDLHEAFFRMLAAHARRLERSGARPARRPGSRRRAARSARGRPAARSSRLQRASARPRRPPTSRTSRPSATRARAA